jgi:hypothetical protein
MATKICPEAIAALLDQLVASYPTRAQEVKRMLVDAGLTEAQIAKHIKLKVGKRETGAPLLSMVEVGTTRPLSPMFAERFSHAGAMHDVTGHFLSQKEILGLLTKRLFRSTFEAQRENWDSSAPATIPPGRLSVVSIQSLADGDLTYLVWPNRDGLEPELWQYAGQHEEKHRDLASYLRHLCG